MIKEIWIDANKFLIEILEREIEERVRREQFKISKDLIFRVKDEK